MSVKARQLKQILARLSDETQVTGIELTFVDNVLDPQVTQTASLSFSMQDMELCDIAVQAESIGCVGKPDPQHCNCCQPPRPPYFHY